ncbi:hypothetical protein BC827DRAFT_1222824, partial [Russula dissimulans]
MWYQICLCARMTKKVHFANSQPATIIFTALFTRVGTGIVVITRLRMTRICQRIYSTNLFGKLIARRTFLVVFPDVVGFHMIAL